MANQNRGRSDEAQDPNRPVNPETGEKEGLGRPETNPGTGQPMTEPNDESTDENGEGADKA